MSKNINVTVLGAGSWGTTLAVYLKNLGHHVSLWEAFPDYAEAMIKTRRNEKYLPGVILAEDIRISFQIEKVVPGADVVIVAVPTQYIRQTFEILQSEVKNLKCLFVSVSKGIEVGTMMRVSEIIKQFYPKQNCVVLSGPSHAEEVSKGMPTSVVAAAQNSADACAIQDLFMSDTFRVYTNVDVVGVELGGAVKNIIAVACGISDGLGFGDNSRAALMTRSIAEIVRLSTFFGADKNTFIGLAGMGDLIATCTSTHSRNHYVGFEIGKGKSLEDVLAGMSMVAEGVQTTRSVVALARKHNIEMPITQQVYEVLFHRKNPLSAVKELMSREAKKE